jgi:hypothetical protein
MTGCERRKPTALDHPELHPTRVADHVLIPRWIPDQLDVGFIYAIDRQNLALGIVGDGRSHSATRRGQCHLHIHARAAVLFLCQLAIVNQSEVDNVHRNFRVITLAQLIPNIIFGNLAIFRSVRGCCWLRFALSLIQEHRHLFPRRGTNRSSSRWCNSRPTIA